MGLLILFAFNSCNAQKKATTKSKIPDGKWVLVQDSLNSVLVKENTIVMYYNNISVDTISYIITKNSCDSTYTPSKKKDVLFLSWKDGICSEIEYLTKGSLMLIYTADGKLSTYRKEK
jgi:membrane protease subunit (stomatin/prohibitin family)